MNPLLWALVSLQLSLPPRPAPLAHFKPVVWDIHRDPKLYTCRWYGVRYRCVFHHNLQPQSSVSWRLIPVYLQT